MLRAHYDCVCPHWQVDHPNIVRMKQVYDCPKVFYMVREITHACSGLSTHNLQLHLFIHL